MDPLNIERWRGLLSRFEVLEQNADTQCDLLATLQCIVQAHHEEIARLSREQIESQAQWQAELEDLRLGLEGDHRRTGRPLGSLTAAQPVPSRETRRYFSRPRFGAAGEPGFSDGQPMLEENMTIVDLTIFRIAASHSPAANEPAPSDAVQHEYIAVHRAMGTPEAAVPALLVSECAETLDRDSLIANGEDSVFSSEQRFQDAFDEYVAKKVMEPGWVRSTQDWVMPVRGGVASVGETVSGSRDWWHELMLGQSVGSADWSTGLDLEPGDGLSGIVTETALPGGSVITEINRIVQVSGIVFGLAVNQPRWINACVKSLAHDILFEAVRDMIGEVVTKTLSLVDVQERDLEVSTVGAELARQAKEMQERLGKHMQAKPKQEMPAAGADNDAALQHASIPSQVAPPCAFIPETIRLGPSSLPRRFPRHASSRHRG